MLWRMVQDEKSWDGEGLLLRRTRVFVLEEYTVTVAEVSGALESLQVDDGKERVRLDGAFGFAVRDAMSLAPTDWTQRVTRGPYSREGG